MLIKNAVVTIESVSYTGQVTAAELVADTPIQQTRTLNPSTVISDVDSTTYVFNMTVSQGTALHEMMLAAADGELLDPIVFQVEAGVGKRKATFAAYNVRPNFGGERGGQLFSTVSLPVNGAVTWSVS